MLQVRDLLEHLQTLPPDLRLSLGVVCLDGTVASADDYALHPAADGSHCLKLDGALVRQIVRDEAEEGE